MWDEETNYDYLNILKDSKKPYFRKTCSYFNIPSKGVVFFFDENNYQDNKYRDIWRQNLGNHLNIEYRREGLSKRSGCTHYRIESLINSDQYGVELYIIDRQNNPFNSKIAKEYAVVSDLDIEKICNFAKKFENRISFGIVGSEKPIIDGIRDLIEKETDNSIFLNR